MRVFHLNCGTMKPPGGRWAPPLVSHCALLDCAEHLVLLDSGFGMLDVEHPEILGIGLRLAARPTLARTETALEQVKRLGFEPEQVRDIVLTHLDVDHTGGLPDFPRARIHVLDIEHRAAMFPNSRMEKSRYAAPHWAHHPRWLVAGLSPETWFGLAATAPLPGLAAEIRLIFLPGHTRGHCGIAVKTASGWLLHAGDAYFHGVQMAERPRRPFALAIFEQAVQVDAAKRRDTQERLRAVLRREPSISAFCSHDAAAFAALNRPA